MIRIVGINSLKNGSPAKIMGWILDNAKNDLRAEVFPFYGVWKDSYENTNSFGFKKEVLISGLLSKLTGLHGVWNVFGTRKLIKELDVISPDIIHLHNIHMWNINIPMLFSYIKKKDIDVVWTLHDCWAFTGQCPYFSAVGCEQWKTGCGKCKQLNRYPGSIVDNTRLMLTLKKKWFLNVKHMKIVTPSEWLLNLVGESFLKDYDSICIKNGIDTNIFQPRKSDFRVKYNLINKNIILGVSLEWGYRKGLDVFLELSRLLDDNCKIVLVGIDKDLRKKIPDNIICIERTRDQNELAEIYSSSDVFINPTREDNFPTVNIESLACGTPVITSNNGGSSEMIDESCGFSIDVSNISEIIECIEKVIYGKVIDRKRCREQAKLYDTKARFGEYAELYKRSLSER